MKAVKSDLFIDLNCDLGEYDAISQGHIDEAILPLISSCNIACGFHAGNQTVIEHTVAMALNNQVNIGAHPSYPDRKNFGRVAMNLPAAALKPLVIEQIQLIKAAAEAQGGCLSHVKPHGALYNQAAEDLTLALLLVEAVAEVDSQLMFTGLAHSKMQQAATQLGVRFLAEGFVDRAYTQARTLVPRSEHGAVLDEAAGIIERVLRMLNEQQLVAISGEVIAIEIDTLCLHGDHANALQTAQSLNQGLIDAGFVIQAPFYQGLHG